MLSAMYSLAEELVSVSQQAEAAASIQRELQTLQQSYSMVGNPI